MQKAFSLLLGVGLLLYNPPARATIFSSVRGIVHDPQHRPVSDARVQLRSATSNWSQQTETNADGEFEFATVPIGIYNITITHEATWRMMRSIGSRGSCVALWDSSSIQAEVTAHLRFGCREACFLNGRLRHDNPGKHVSPLSPELARLEPTYTAAHIHITTVPIKVHFDLVLIVLFNENLYHPAQVTESSWSIESIRVCELAGTGKHEEQDRAKIKLRMIGLS